jgi:energy-coupling factor transporter transmembrane protein EcfT
MNILFENNHTRTKELAKEIYRHYFFKRPLYVVVDIIFGLAFIANMVSLALGRYYINSVLFIVPLFIAFQFYLCFISVKAMVKRDNEVNSDKPIHMDTIVTDEFIRNMASTGSVYEIPYSKIKKAMQTKNLVLLWSKANLIYIFHKDTFTKGSAVEFVAFLRDKGFKC